MSKEDAKLGSNTPLSTCQRKVDEIWKQEVQDEAAGKELGASIDLLL
jgi:hypothetical protein